VEEGGVPEGGRAGAGAYWGGNYIGGGDSIVRIYCMEVLYIIVLVDVAPACRWSLLSTGTSTVFPWECVVKCTGIILRYSSGWIGAWVARWWGVRWWW
jgi:hypothetical protein